MKTSEILTKAKNILLDPDAWCKEGCYAAENTGMETEVLSEHATQFCAIGAMYRTVGYEPVFGMCRIPELLLAEGRLDEAANFVLDRESETRMDIAEFNDDPRTTHEMLLRVYDRAIQEQLSIETA